MKITLKLFASLGQYLPEGAQRNVIEIDVADNATPSQVIREYRVPKDMAKLVTRNGVYVPPADRDTEGLKENDELAVWPPVAGG